MKLLNSSTNSIWRYNGYYQRKISDLNQIFLESEPTPLEEFNGILLKREDKSTSGSHKFRPLSYQVATLLEDEIKDCTISSSGNAAITLSHLPIKSHIFISPHTPKSKKSQINTNNAQVIESGKAMRFSNYLSKKADYPQLRPSKDDNAIEGYKSLGFELYEQDPWIDAIFFFISSGASLLGVYEAYQQLLEEGTIKHVPALHAVIAQDLKDSLSGLCVANKMRRRKEVEQAIKATYGQTWSVTNQELELAEKELVEQGVESSYESIASYVVCQKGRDKYKNPVAIFSGKKWEDSEEDMNFQFIESFDELDEYIKNLSIA